MSARIVSLAPAATDLLCALGLAERIVGVSHACDHPAVEGVPVVTRSRLPSAEGAAAIDRAVREAWREGGALYEVDARRVRALCPSLLVAQELCAVCAVDAASARAAMPEGCALACVTASSVTGLEDDLRALAGTCGVPGRAEERVAELRARLAMIVRAVEGAPRRRVLALEWGDPPFSGGHWVPELIALAGGEEVIGRAGEASRCIDGRAILAADPELILYLPCGYSLDQAVTEAREVLRRPEAQAVPATRRGDVWALDANRLFSRCTTELARAVEVLAGILHPDRCEPPRASEAAQVRVGA
jgi:iron complex transport system substrate-binding protein